MALTTCVPAKLTPRMSQPLMHAVWVSFQRRMTFSLIGDMLEFVARNQIDNSDLRYSISSADALDTDRDYLFANAEVAY